MVGGPCTVDSQCDSATGAADGICLQANLGGSVSWPAIGYCMNRLDSCTSTNCGPGNSCVTLNDPGGAFRACLPACSTGPCPCPPGQLCAGSFSGTTFANGATACMPANPAAIDGAPCVGFGDCAVDSMCINDGLESPGGQCFRVACTIGMDSTCVTGGDGHCIDQRLITSGVSAQNVCVDQCTVNGDCRTAQGYRCLSAGGTVGNYCRHPQAGDPCAVDADCGDAAMWDCKTGVLFPGGMCTPTTGCPTPGASTGCSPFSSVCYDSILASVPTDNVCVDRCGGPVGTQGGCRTGYVCRDVNPAPSVATLGCVNP